MECSRRCFCKLYIPSPIQEIQSEQQEKQDFESLIVKKKKEGLEESNLTVAKLAQFLKIKGKSQY